ncbi:hypothetical protein [Ligilactobacillus pobuzihii]|uniref:Uncharacterized protein n=1 Tax=Ligilactobacillus pobuzihii TaxID=449659 RepID=A0A0R2LCG4_9LACO|nr:hypothetical protein [Ligilactobacillus pobuzihii]KRK08961.1 hypothetical protein FD11_GL001627 [Ligilactobacillus pobuzihii E100301 = KCTC 13174]KRN99598.1 hypothetical protein IV66_GL001604 [Ligilactobacillus pobuzihii]GEN48304.1 hypothetical protein LPO01_10960 [Ligilactobacillus pobuzihii]
MRKKLFNANYEDSAKLVTRKQIKLNKEGFKFMKLRHRIFLPFLVSFFMAPFFYMIGTQMPLGISDKENYFSEVMAKYGTIFSDTIKLILLVWVGISVLFLIQRKNYGNYVIFAYFAFFPMILSFCFIMFDFMFGVAVAGVGIVGSIVMIVAGLLYIFMAIYNVVNDMKSSLYGETKRHFSSRYYLLITCIALVLTVIVSLIFPAEEFNLLLYVIAFGLLIAFAGIALLAKIMLHMFCVSYYFAKYGEQYKKKFKITDEQWYGPRKAKRLAKKKGK